MEFQRQLNLEGKATTVNAIKTYYYKDCKSQKSLVDLLSYHNLVMANVIKTSTLSHYFTTEKYLIEFLQTCMKSRDVNLIDISFEFISEFECFLRKKSKLNHNGVMKHLTRLKKLLNLAIKLDWISRNPFVNFTVRFLKTERDILNKMEFAAIEGADFERPCLEIAKDMFVFSCYTELSFIDIQNLNEEHIIIGNDGGLWIRTNRAKTNITVKIPILDKAERILNKYSGNDRLISGDAVLPIYSNQKTNQYLKEIAKNLNIQKKLTFQVARHTFPP